MAMKAAILSIFIAALGTVRGELVETTERLLDVFDHKRSHLSVVPTATAVFRIWTSFVGNTSYFQTYSFWAGIPVAE